MINKKKISLTIFDEILSKKWVNFYLNSFLDVKVQKRDIFILSDIIKKFIGNLNKFNPYKTLTDYFSDKNEAIKICNELIKQTDVKIFNRKLFLFNVNHFIMEFFQKIRIWYKQFCILKNVSFISGQTTKESYNLSYVADSLIKSLFSNLDSIKIVPYILKQNKWSEEYDFFKEIEEKKIQKDNHPTTKEEIIKIQKNTGSFLNSIIDLQNALNINRISLNPNIILKQIGLNNTNFYENKLYKWVMQERNYIVHNSFFTKINFQIEGSQYIDSVDRYLPISMFLIMHFIYIFYLILASLDWIE